ncbi:MAG TPA: hypothetical protein VKG02_23960 [Blastocatellia bacterium]|nr:hypothetical protein [Blastocatellia bacterium]
MLKLLLLSTATRFTLAGAAVIAITPLCLSFMPARRSGRPVVIKNVRIFDGSTAIPTGAVIIEGGKIKSVGKTADPPDGAEIIDGTGWTGATRLESCLLGARSRAGLFSRSMTWP